MKKFQTLLLCGGLLLLLEGCHPHIYKFKVDPKTIGMNDPVMVSWKVKGAATLLIHDLNYPGFGTAKLSALTLLITQHGKTTAFLLNPDSTLKIPLSIDDSLVVQKKKDNIIDDRLRYFTLVANKKAVETDSLIQVAVRPDSVSDEIGFRTVIQGDSLVAKGINNPVRWGNNFDILTVADSSARPMDVAHANITRQLQAGGQRDEGFKGTPVKGDWVFRTLMTPEEKSDHRLVPNFLKISITIKHH